MSRVAAFAGMALALVLVPAAAGTARGRTAAPAPALRLQLAGRLGFPTYAASAPGDTDVLYVASRAGTVQAFSGARLDRAPLLDLRGRVSTKGERGLLSFAFDPGYQQNGYLYAAYTDRAGSLVVSRFRVARGRAPLSSAHRLLRVARPPSHPYHYGGQLAFAPDGALYVSTGDGGYGTGPAERRVCRPGTRNGRRMVICSNTAIDVGHAQNPATLFGKVLRLDVRAARPRPAVVAYGLRNPWRFSFDRATGALYIGDVGFDRYEEVDYAPRLGGRLLNFGWSYYEGLAREANGAKRLDRRGRLVRPIYVYGHGQGCSITGGYVYRGSKVPALRGRYVFGDFCTGRIWSLAVAGGRATGVRRERIRVRRLTSFGGGPGGELYALALTGEIYRIVA